MQKYLIKFVGGLVLACLAHSASAAWTGYFEITEVLVAGDLIEIHGLNIPDLNTCNSPGAVVVTVATTQTRRNNILATALTAVAMGSEIRVNVKGSGCYPYWGYSVQEIDGISVKAP